MKKPSKSTEITEQVMTKIKAGQVHMKPKVLMAGISLLWAVGLSAFTILSVYLVNLLVFRLRVGHHFSYLAGPRPRLGMFLGNFPWGLLLLAVAAVGLAIYLARQHDFSYRNSHYAALIFLAGFAIAFGFFLAQTNFNQGLQRRLRPTRHFYQNQERIDRPAPMMPYRLK